MHLVFLVDVVYRLSASLAPVNKLNFKSSVLVPIINEGGTVLFVPSPLHLNSLNAIFVFIEYASHAGLAPGLCVCMASVR